MGQGMVTGRVGGEEAEWQRRCDYLAKEFPSSQAAREEGKTHTAHGAPWQSHVPSLCQLLPAENTTQMGKRGRRYRGLERV